MEKKRAPGGRKNDLFDKRVEILLLKRRAKAGRPRVSKEREDAKAEEPRREKHEVRREGVEPRDGGEDDGRREPRRLIEEEREQLD